VCFDADFVFVDCISYFVGAIGAWGEVLGDGGDVCLYGAEGIIKTLPDNVPWVVNNVEVTSITGIHGVCPTSPIHSVRSEGGDANYPRGG
ncbi:MAG: hypothetical protein ACK575_14190, partial [Cyanobacteriota bacterium]